MPESLPQLFIRAIHFQTDFNVAKFSSKKAYTFLSHIVPAIMERHIHKVDFMQIKSNDAKETMKYIKSNADVILLHSS